MAVFTQKVVDYYHWAMEIGDPRTSHWFLMSTPWSTIGLVLLYILSVILGPKLMKTRQAFDLKSTLIVYNFGLVLLSLYMICEFMLSVSSIPNFNYWCDAVAPGNDPSLLRYASVNWIYFISKIVEFFDTIFFILRKKDNQITFLHVYHHVSMCLLWWTVVKWNPGGTSYFGAVLNCFVHVVMYSYYMLSAFGPQYRKYLWWKKYLTSLQLLQFCLVVVHTTIAIYSNCGFSRGFLLLLWFYMLTLLFLFADFYRTTYCLQSNDGVIISKNGSARNQAMLRIKDD